MKEINTRKTEEAKSRETQNKRMIPICVLQYLIENTNCNNRATVQDISNGLGDYGVFANRDTVQKTLTDLISRKDDLIDMGFPEIKYEEIRRKNKNYVENANEIKSADEKDDKWQTMLTNFYAYRSDEGNSFVSNGLNLSETEVALILNLLAPGRKDRDSFVEELADKLEKIGSAQKTLTNTGISAPSKKQTLGAKYVSEVIKTINEAIYYKQQIKFVPRHYNQNLRLVHSNKIVIFDPYIVIGNNVIGVESGESDLKSYRIDKFHPYPERVEKGIKEGNPTDDEEVTDDELPTPVIKLKRNRFSNKSDYEIYTYLSRHPDLDESNPIRVIMDLKLDAIDVFADTFGTDFGKNDGIRVEIPGEDPIPSGYCRASLWVSYSYILRWALMHADKCIIIKPQSLRNRLQQIARYMRVSYIRTKEDKEFYAMDTCVRGNCLLIGKQVNVVSWNRNNRRYDDMTESERISAVRRIELAGICAYIPIELSQFINTEKLSIRSVWSIDNLSFVSKYKNLEYLNLKDTAVSNISAISSCRRLAHVEFCKNPIDDYSVLYDLAELKELLIDDLSKVDVDRLKTIYPGIVIRSIDGNGRKYDV